jgi:L-seryl-tRNA(Ser) seleniumtransferase
MELKHEEFKKLPGVDKLLVLPEIKILIAQFNVQVVKYAIRTTLDHFRSQALKSEALPEMADIIEGIGLQVQKLTSRSLRSVINATGIVIHTNLGRAPYSDDIIRDASAVLKGYNNLEFDLNNGVRGSRNTHLADLLKYLTGAEDVLVVNNNAAALMLVLRSYAKGKEVIVSRGELIEIGGSFRLPEIMAASDCKMVEVGTTNKTSIKDYEKAVTPKTRLLLKAHKSNYVIHGFTQEAELQELVALGKKMKIPVMYDMGSGLLRKTGIEIFKDEPDVKETLATGVDIVSFSGDKLLGGAQAGIIAGKEEYIARLKKEPMVRALRVGKTALAFMEAALSYYLDDKYLFEKNLLFKLVTTPQEELRGKAQRLKNDLNEKGIVSEILPNVGQCGGGALPDKEIKSVAVRIEQGLKPNRKKSEFSEKLYHHLMMAETPVVAILRKGDIIFDVLTVPNEQMEILSRTICDVYSQIKVQ